MLKHEFTPLEIDEASLAFGAHEEVGPGGHFLGAAHTLERFRECFYRPLLSSTENFERWKRNGGLDATARAEVIWRARSRSTSSRRSTRRSAPSSRSTSIAAGPSWAELDAPAPSPRSAVDREARVRVDLAQARVEAGVELELRV